MDRSGWSCCDPLREPDSHTLKHWCSFDNNTLKTLHYGYIKIRPTHGSPRTDKQCGDKGEPDEIP